VSADIIFSFRKLQFETARKINILSHSDINPVVKLC